MKDAIIWRKSIHDNDYVCRCGKKLFENGEVAEDVLTDTDYLICPQCRWLVAKLSTVEDAIKSGAMRDAVA